MRPFDTLPAPWHTKKSYSARPAERPAPTVMRLVADESCDISVIVGVRGAGHDVIAIAELMSGIDDEKVIELAASQQRLLLTEDKDFITPVAVEVRPV